MVKIVGIAGGLHPNSSCSQQILKRVGDRLTALGADLTRFDLCEMDMSLCDGSKDDSDRPDVDRLRQAFFDADGCLLVTPECHGSGGLKNTLDLMRSPHPSTKSLGSPG